MDFAQFCRILQTSELFFCRPDQLGDPYEGAYPAGNEQLRRLLIEQRMTDPTNSPFANVPVDQVEQLLSVLGRRLPTVVATTFICCWHMNEIESAAMWTIYGKTNSSIGLQSTYAKLRSTLSPAILISEVQYADYETAFLRLDNAYWPFVHKRHFFEYERELRALMSGPEGLEARGVPITKYDHGVGVKVDLNELFEHIYVSPSSPPWFVQTVSDIVQKYGLKLPVVQSNMNKVPIR